MPSHAPDIAVFADMSRQEIAQMIVHFRAPRQTRVTLAGRELYGSMEYCISPFAASSAFYRFRVHYIQCRIINTLLYACIE